MSLAGRGLVVEEWRTADRLTADADSWTRLLRDSGLASPFLSPQWFRSCLLAYGKGKRPLILVVRDAGELVGVAPLWLASRRVRGVRLRCLECIHGLDTPFIELIVQPSRRDEVLAGLLDHLYNRRLSAWEIARLGPWCSDSPNLARLGACVERAGGKIVRESSTQLPYLPLEEGWEAFLRSRSAKYRKTTRNIANRMRRLGAVEVQCHKRDPDGRILSDVLAVSARSWKHRAGVGLATVPEAREFFREWTRHAEDEGSLLVWLLKYEGEPIAMEYDLEHDGRVYALRSDFDERYGDYSPGSFLQSQILQRLMSDGYKEYNTGPGANDYKLHTADRMGRTSAVTFFNNNLKATLVWAMEKHLVPTARALRQGLARAG